MTDAELEALLEELEAQLAVDVQSELSAVSREFARSLDAADEIMAALFSVSSIRTMWQRRVPRIMDALRTITRRARRVVAADLRERPPSPGEFDAALGSYFDDTARLLDEVGDRMAAQARQQLAEGVAAGQSAEQLKSRLKVVFRRNGAQLGPVRADRIAHTEATRAFNAGIQAAASLIQGPDRPLVKQWITRHDEKVRRAHKDADGQIQLLDDAFDVGGVAMQYPGDPTAPADLTIGCRCILKTQAAPQGRTASVDPNDGVAELASRMPPQLKRYWLLGEGAAKIRWGTPGSFDRCVRALRDDFPQDPEGLCANLYHEATGQWPGRRGKKSNASSGQYSGAMVALMPSEADARRLAAFTDESADQLHVTLMYLGEAADYDEAARNRVIDSIGATSEWLSPVDGRVFGVSLWNPDKDSPVWVWNIGDDHRGGNRHTLGTVQSGVMYGLENRHGGTMPDMPAQYTPWAPHMAVSYDDIGDPGDHAPACGPVTFDRIRVGFGGEYTDFDLTDNPEAEPMDIEDVADELIQDGQPAVATWSTPDDTALAFENQQTGDCRVFAPDALYWDGNGPWPLMANENFDSHDDASLAGAIASLYRDGGRVGGDGLLYLTQECGAEAAMMLAQGAPLGVSVDLDDVDLEMVDMNDTGGTPMDGTEPYRARLLRASVLPLPDGGFVLKGMTASHRLTAGSTGNSVLEGGWVTFVVGPDGTVPRAAFELEAAAGDKGTGGTVVDSQNSGDYLMRITRARVRGATLVTIPAFANARITLDDPTIFGPAGSVTAAGWSGKSMADSANDYDRVLRHVRRSKAPVGPARVAQFLKIPIQAVQRMLARAASRGEVVKLTKGLYTDSTTSAKSDHVMTDDRLTASLTASATGSVDLPVAARDAAWDGPGAASRVFTWADGDCAKLDKAFAYRDDSAPCEEKRSRKLGFADVVDGELTIIPRGVFAAQAALEGARGGVQIPSDQKAAVRDRLASIRSHVDEETGGAQMDDMKASAWAAMADLPAMPAEWFREPTAEELPPGGAGVNYANGRIFGWVAQANEPHAGYAKRIVVNDLGRIDTSHFLRQRFTLDDGSVVKAGAFTMNAGHHRDGAECETAVCQFDDTRTVAGIVTVGMNERGLWFSGAAAPWMSEWDRSVFAACQPSYHMKQGANGQWQLRAVLSVPVPGHSSPLLATAVVERSQLALTAAATMVEVEEAVRSEQRFQDDEKFVGGHRIGQAPIDYDRLADSLVAAFQRAEQVKAADAAELEALLSEGRTMDGKTGTEGV